MGGGEVAYDFEMPIIQGLLARRALEAQAAAEEPKPLLSLLSNPEQPAPAEQSPPQPQQSPTPQPQPQEPLDGKQMIDVSMAKALDIPQAPNPYALNVQRGLLTQKQAYADAKTDADRATAHSAAELLRNKANAAGIDVSGYGSGVSLGDAVNNLASQEARDIMGALQGYYSRDSGQYYNDEYWRGIERGLSPRKAQKVAEALTGSYKADRVQYLDGLLNSYGRDDTALANQIIASMIPESPAIAQFYALTNPNPLNEYNTAVDVAKQLANNGYQINLIRESGDQTRRNQNNAAGLDNQRLILSEKLGRETYGIRKNIDYNYEQMSEDQAAIRESAMKAEDAARAFDYQIRWAQFTQNQQAIAEATKRYNEALAQKQKIADLYGWADRLGFKGIERDRFVATRLGILTKENKEVDNSIVKKGKDYIANLAKRQETAYKMLTSEYATEEDKAGAREELNNVNNQMRELDVMFGEELGAMGSMDVTPYTGDESVDSQTLRTLLGDIAKKSGGNISPDVAVEATKDWVKQSGKELGDDEIKALIEKAIAR